MRVFACPAEIPEPKPDFRNYNHEVEAKREAEHQAALRQWLVTHGYDGKRTGETVSFPVADGRAIYMLAEGRQSALIHLGYGDGYSYPHAQFLPKREILQMIDRQKKRDALFAAHAEAKDEEEPQGPAP